MRYSPFGLVGAAAVFSAASLLSDCTQVPSLNETTGSTNSLLFVNEVVARIKCELAIAYADKPANYPFLKDWTVKTDLSLQVNEQGGISPSLSYTKFQTSAVNVGAGPASTTSSALGLAQQFVTTSVSANVGAQMTATQAESFTMSLTELTAFYFSPDYDRLCRPAQGAGLLGNLRLREWADTSLSGIDARILQAGKHKAPGSAGAAKPQVTGKPTTISGGGSAALIAKADPLEDPIKKKVLNDIVAATQKASNDTIGNLNTVSDIYRRVKENLDSAEKALNNYSPISTEVTSKELRKQVSSFQTLLSQAQNAKDCVLQQVCGQDYGDCSAFGRPRVDRHKQSFEMCESPKCVPPFSSANTSGTKQEAECSAAARNLAFTDQTLYDKLLAFAQDSSEAAKINLTNSSTVAGFAQGLTQKSVTTPDAPIDSISTTIQFEVAVSAGVTPSWTLIYFKGPGINGPFVAATLNRTHILQIALGSPSASGSSSLEQNRVLQNQILLLPNRGN